MLITLGFSPCPNDTFIFDALVNGKMDTGGLQFEVILEDVQTLNEWAREGKLDVSKVSYGSLPHIIDDYIVLNSGGALGKGVGPLLVTAVNKPPATFEELNEWINHAQVAIPGADTTAHFLFKYTFPNAVNKTMLRFNEIEDWLIKNNETTTGASEDDGGKKEKAGVIIHENRFTYQQKGLHKLTDLGEHWEATTGMPIPLGGIVAKRTLGLSVQQQLDKLIAQSLLAARAEYPELAPYVKQHAQEMDEEVMRQHIDLYVNDYSIDLRDDGRRAVARLMNILRESGTTLPDPIFVASGK